MKIICHRTFKNGIQDWIRYEEKNFDPNKKSYWKSVVTEIKKLTPPEDLKNVMFFNEETNNLIFFINL